MDLARNLFLPALTVQTSLLQRRILTLWDDVAAAKASGGQWQQCLVPPRPKSDGVHAGGTCTLAPQVRVEPDALELLCARARGTELETSVCGGLGAGPLCGGSVLKLACLPTQALPTPQMYLPRIGVRTVIKGRDL